MDRSKLLEEFVKLERLLKEHENKQARLTTNNSNLNGKKCCHHLSRERIKSTIFFNPTKLNVINDCATKVPEKLSNHATKLSGKVFINPNFRKPDKLSAEVKVKPPLNREEEKQKTRNLDHINKSRSNSFLHVNNGSEKLFSQHREVSSNQSQKVAEPTVAQKNTLNSNNHVIFINPQFSSTSKINTQLLNTTTRIVKERSTTVRQEFCNKNLDSDIKESEQKLSVIVSRKRKVVTNDTLAKNQSTRIDQKRSKRAENIAKNVKKIFVNPNFEKKECDSNNTGPSNSESKLSVMNINCLVSSSRDNQTLNTRASAIPVLLCGKQVPSKYTAVSYPLCAIVGPDRGKQIGKKTTAQRVRTRSTSLVTVSTTKLVRKRRSSQKVIETGRKTLPQPMYVSKTKLVRNVTKKEINNTCMAKIKLKQISQRTPAQITSTEKALKPKRKSFTDGSLNLTSSTSRPTVVTKIRSKNGKSLKLIRKSADTMSLGLKAKTLNMINARKVELRKQASKAAVCLLQSRMKRNKFSKINVPVKVSHSPSYNINMYKKNNVSRKPLTKSALLGTKEAGSIIGKTQTRSMPLDMTKFIKSKYRLIRKQSSNTMSRYKLGQKVTNKISLQNKLALCKKLKWKQKSNTPKRKLTRKDLSIKKIGGVFYRYSRTTLTRNKPPSKLVSQLQRKSICQVTPESRQNRFCLNKNARRKRTSVSGSFTTTSCSGMTWRRSSSCSARSILTQAKQKSIHLLSKKLKKNNEPCLFFHRYGKCAGLERGTCVRLHDRKFVAVCKKFVAGQCSDEGCRLSHSPSCHNMPTCHHFLAGHCGRDLCPYPHIKVSDAAPVCLAFLKGYCPLGDQCSKRHFEICPSFEKGICARGKYCPYPHPKNKSGEKLLGKFKHIKRKPLPSKEIESVSTPSLRYFEDVNLQNENKNHLDEDEEDHEDNDSEAEVEEVIRLKKRPQLGDLPSFIPLSRGDDT